MTIPRKKLYSRTSHFPTSRKKLGLEWAQLSARGTCFHLFGSSDLLHFLGSWFLEISGPRLRFLPRLGKSLLHVTLHSASDISPSILIVYSTYDIAQLVHVQIHKLIHRACPVRVEKRTVGFAVTGADRVEPLFDGRLNLVALHLEHTVGRIGGRHVWRGYLYRGNLRVHSLLLDISGSNVLGRALLFVFPVCG